MRKAVALTAVFVFATAAMPFAASNDAKLGCVPRSMLPTRKLPMVEVQGMGWASWAVPGLRSENPAAIARGEGILTELMFSRLEPATGPKADALRGDVAFPLWEGSDSAMRVTWAGIDSELDLSLVSNLDAEYETSSVALFYGKALDDRFSFGLGLFPHDSGEVELSNPVLGKWGKATLEGEVWNCRVGGLALLGEHFSVALGLDYAQYDVDARYWRPRATEDSGTFRTVVWTGGLGFFPDEASVLTVEYSVGEHEGCPYTEDVDRWRLGAQRRVLDWLWLRAGVDDGAETVGFTIEVPKDASMLPRDFQLHYAYTSHGMRGSAPYFGKTDVHSVSLSLRF